MKALVLDAMCLCGHTREFHALDHPARCRVGEGSLLHPLCPCRSFTDRCPGSFAESELSSYRFDGEHYHGTIECPECGREFTDWFDDTTAQVPKHTTAPTQGESA